MTDARLTATDGQQRMNDDDDRQDTTVRKCWRSGVTALESQSSSLHRVLWFHRTETCLELLLSKVAVGVVDSFCVPGKGATRVLVDLRVLFLGAVTI